ncbi:MAG TPA: hypothetical protein VIV14_03170 [Gammaproteobacteria bacterium]
MATAFAGVAILADLGLGFPRDLNVPRPESLLFYPVMGFVAEIVLQVFPLAVLLTVLNRLVEDVSAERRIRISIVAVSLLEPIFQVTVGSTGRPLLDGFVFLHVFAFCLVQLAVFRRFDFVSMYVFRLVYYLYWHIIWGYFR